MSIGYCETLAAMIGDGTALTAAARASLTQGAAGQTGRVTLIPNKLRVGDVLEINAMGRISCVVTTPGTARFDLSFGGTACFDTLAMPLNIVAKTNVMWNLWAMGVVRSTGSSGTIMWGGWWLSEANINTAVPSTGPGPGGQNVPYNTAPVVGSIDTTVSQAVDLQFTQTVATGSCQMHNYVLTLRTSTGY